MNTLLAEARLCFDLVTAPRSALETLATRAPVGVALALLCLLQGALSLVQWHILRPALLADPMLADAPEAASRLVIARLAGLVLLPCGMAVRTAGLATVLQGGLALGGSNPPWRRLWSITVHAELIFWIESACTTLLLVLRPPAELEALRQLHLRAGIDLFWQPQSPQARALANACSVFTLWWAALLGWALAHFGKRGVAIGLATLVWLALVAARCAQRLW